MVVYNTQNLTRAVLEYQVQSTLTESSPITLTSNGPRPTSYKFAPIKGNDWSTIALLN
jgi:hypothetical protein